MRVWLVACVILLLTACGAQPAAPATAAATLPAAIAAASVVPVAQAPVSTATAPPTRAVAPVTPAAAQAATVAPALTEYTADNGDRVQGKPGAPITMLDYSDFQ